jgi:voltage-dependent calcium channel alpha-2/delta-3
MAVVRLFTCERKGFEMAFDLFNGKMKTGCQSVLVFVTDGQDIDSEAVRCGPGA